MGIIDDLLVYGVGDTEEDSVRDHDKCLLALLDRARARNLKLNPEKIQFKLKQIAFMGFCITEEGVCTDPSRIQAITQMPVPTSKLAIQRFIRMVNYLNTFCPALTETISLLHSLTRQDQPFVWADIHQRSFAKAKELMACSSCLAYFNVNKVTSCAAS